MENSLRLFEHQASAIKAALKCQHLLVVRALGSGKTIIALKIAERILAEKDGPVLLIGPAHLTSQYVAEKEKWGVDVPVSYLNSHPKNKPLKDRLYIASYARLRLSKKYFLSYDWGAVIADECHKAKNPDTQNHMVLRLLAKKANRFTGFTGAPMQNGPKEFFSMMEMVANKSFSLNLERCLEYKRPSDISKFKKFFFNLLKVRHNRGAICGVKDPVRLRKMLSPYVNYDNPLNYSLSCNIPKIDNNVIRVAMTAFETNFYLKIARKYRRKNDRLLMQDSLDEALIERSCNRLAALRQALLTIEGEPSSKVRALVNHVAEYANKEQNRVLIFSNFVEKGVEIISNALYDDNIHHAVFTGTTNKSSRNNIVDGYLSGEYRIMLLSPVGFEGLDLVGTTHVFVADPHYNPERTAQLMARATRANSDIQKVAVYHYLSTSEKIRTGTIDEAIYKIAKRKNKINQMIREVLNTYENKLS